MSDLVAANSELLAKAKVLNPDVPVMQELVGYDYDSAFPLLIRYLTPPASVALSSRRCLGAVISTLAAMLNAASTIFTMDIYRELINPGASQRALVWFGRCCIPVAVVIGCFLRPNWQTLSSAGLSLISRSFRGTFLRGC